MSFSSLDLPTIVIAIAAIASALIAYFEIRHARETDRKNLQQQILDRIFAKYDQEEFKRARRSVIDEYRKHLSEEHRELTHSNYFEGYLRINLLLGNRYLEKDLARVARDMEEIAVMVKPHFSEKKEESEIEELYFDAYWNSILRVWPAIEQYLTDMKRITGNNGYGDFFANQIRRAHRHWGRYHERSTIRFYDLGDELERLARNT